MKTYQKLTTTLSLLTCASALFSATTASAAIYHVDVDTTSLVGNANAPFYLDFQFNYGSGSFGNSASMQNFLGVTPVGGSTFLSGTATGDLSSSVNLSVNSVNPYNEFYQTFTPGAHVGFDVFLSQNPTLLAPDSLQFAILDSTTYQIPTTQPGLGLSLAQFNINANGSITASGFAGANDINYGDYSGVTLSVTAVPEPSTTVMSFFAAGLGMAAMLRARKAAAKTA